ncbi:MAG: rRNA maturation RNase YbeY [Spirochaetota bacterium]
MAIMVTVEREQISVPKEILLACKKVVAYTLKYQEVDNVVVTLILTNDDVITHINKTYRKKKGPTDVISFAYREAPMPYGATKEHLGDIFISLETAQRQAMEYKVTLKEEMKRLLVHGVLHLLGYDHEQSAYKKRMMQKKEQEIMEKI